MENEKTIKGFGAIRTDKSIDVATNTIKTWLFKIKVSGLDIDTRYDPSLNVALLRFKYNGKNYEFRSTKQKNCRLNMFGIARVMEFKVRAHLMGIEDFGTSMQAYLQLEDKTGSASVSSIPQDVNQRNYIILGVSPLASNDEIKNVYVKKVKAFHPDMALSEEAKMEFEKRISEINVAYDEIKRERNIK